MENNSKYYICSLNKVIDKFKVLIHYEMFNIYRSCICTVSCLKLGKRLINLTLPPISSLKNVLVAARSVMSLHSMLGSGGLTCSAGENQCRP